jgi:hypothetical protein
MTTCVPFSFAALTGALLASVLALPVQVDAESTRPRIELNCVSFGTGPMLECLVKVQRHDGKPLNNAQVTLGALMPSMPMAHTIKPVKAEPTANPGEYKGTLELQMLGVWTVDVDLSGPTRDKFARNFLINECKGSARCISAPSVPSARTDDSGKGHRHVDHGAGKH